MAERGVVEWVEGAWEGWRRVREMIVKLRVLRFMTRVMW
jgi:hypothetical protein